MSTLRQIMNSTSVYQREFINTTDSTPQSYIWVSEERYITIIQVITSMVFTIASCGIVLNALNIKTFVLMGLKDGVTLTFMCLAISDFCATVAASIMSGARLCLTLEEKYNVWFGLDPFAVHIFTMNMVVIFNILTTLTTAFIAIARCMCVASPFKFKNKFTKKRCLLIFITFFCIAVSFWIPVYSNMGIATAFDPERNASRRVLWFSKYRGTIKDIVVSIIFVPLALIAEIIIVVCVLIMAAKLRESLRFRQKESTTEKESTKLTGKERSVVVQVVTISGIFIVCNFTKITHGLFSNVDQRFDIGSSGHFLYMTISNALILSDCINNSANFFVYTIFNSRFRSLVFTFRSQ